ncbi:putative carbohydrate-binding module family 63 protein [Phytophthora infestans]|uniref:Putative Carbohydrate-binding module family 63 protein n=1 Tax=Phytophthora infestans TaxID=4787 RepID=A0A833SSP2_PHYIN|nr:putative carbohydrate-binding module family 63 protein [Phytophthora infestans]KAF4148853.1 putative Carbohydrate-binding module family 63 protein [Phytophthora infestans]
MPNAWRRRLGLTLWKSTVDVDNENNLTLSNWHSARHSLEMAFRMIAALSFTAVASAEYFEGDGTSYTLGDVSSGNCNFMSAVPTASTNYAALNNDQWDNLANCGRCAEVSCIDDQCADQTTTAIVQILDRCPECSSGDLDLSPTVLKNITGSDPSRLSIRWKFMDCPNPGSIEVCLKSGSNGYYVAVQPTNTLVGVEIVTINGESTTMVDSAYYYLIESTSDVDLTSVAVSITSVEGETVEGTYSLTAGACVNTKQQFTTSSSDQTTTYTTTTPTNVHCAYTSVYHSNACTHNCYANVHHGYTSVYRSNTFVHHCYAHYCGTSVHYSYTSVHYGFTSDYDANADVQCCYSDAEKWRRGHCKLYNGRRGGKCNSY